MSPPSIIPIGHLYAAQMGEVSGELESRDPDARLLPSDAPENVTGPGQSFTT